MFDNDFYKRGPIFKILHQLIREKVLYVDTPDLRYVATVPCE